MAPMSLGLKVFFYFSSGEIAIVSLFCWLVEWLGGWLVACLPACLVRQMPVADWTVGEWTVGELLLFCSYRVVATFAHADSLDNICLLLVWPLAVDCYR